MSYLKRQPLQPVHNNQIPVPLHLPDKEHTTVVERIPEPLHVALVTQALVIDLMIKFRLALVASEQAMVQVGGFALMAYLA